MQQKRLSLTFWPRKQFFISAGAVVWCPVGPFRPRGTPQGPHTKMMNPSQGRTNNPDQTNPHTTTQHPRKQTQCRVATYQTCTFTPFTQISKGHSFLVVPFVCCCTYNMVEYNTVFSKNYYFLDITLIHKQHAKCFIPTSKLTKIITRPRKYYLHHNNKFM